MNHEDNYNESATNYKEEKEDERVQMNEEFTLSNILNEINEGFYNTGGSKKPFYRTWWFMWLIIIILSCIAFYFVWKNKEQVMKLMSGNKSATAQNGGFAINDISVTSP